MGSRLRARDRELLLRIDEVLHYLWDPIGVRDVPRARDEYETYVPGVFRLLDANAGAERIAEHLMATVTELGLVADPVRAGETAALLLDWKEAVDERFAAGDLDDAGG